MHDDFKSIMQKYKNLINELSNSGNIMCSLERISVKITNAKKAMPLNEIGTLNVIDPLKAELTTHDPQVRKYILHYINIYIHFNFVLRVSLQNRSYPASKARV